MIEKRYSSIDQRSDAVSKRFDPQSVCNPVANVANAIRPLPGVLDHRTFSRVRADLGRCDICGKARTVYRSRETQAGICEGCYARLVREWNAKAGVR